MNDHIQFLEEYYIDEFRIDFDEENTTSTTSTTPNGTTITTPTTLSPTTAPEGGLSSGFIILALFLGIFGGFGCVILIGVIFIKRKLKKYNTSQQSSRNNNAYEMNTYNQSEA